MKNTNYKQGGKIDRAALGDTNTAIATKNKLKKNFDLPFEVAVYVPSTSDANRTISKQDFENRINEVSEYLANVFGGFSSNEVSGGYVSSEKGLIKEGVYKVTSFASKENLDSNMKKLISQIKKWCKDWSQESIGLEFEGDLYYLSETAEYKNGGIMYAQGGDIESIKMDMDLIKKQYPKAKVSYFFAKNPNGKNYVIVARENNKIVYSSYHNKYAQGGDIETTFTYQIGGL